MDPERALTLLKAVAAKNYRAPDISGNDVCFFCGDFLKFTQPDGRRPGAHKADCLWATIKAFVETPTE